MHLKYNYWYFPKVIKKETCNKIISTCLKKKQVKGLVHNRIEKEEKLSLKKRVNPNIRNCWVSWINDKWIYDILNPFIHLANRNAGWNFEWDWNESCQFTHYDKNQFYSWHCDQLINSFTDSNKNINGKTRKLSLTLQLTDESRYKGGDFQFKSFFKKKVKIDTVKSAKELGTIIIFPSFIYHQITPITHGTRESLVNWSLGKPFI